MKRCQFCAEEIQDAAVVCKHCGRDLAGQSKSTQPTSAAKNGCALVLLLVIGLSMVLAIIGTLWPAKPRGIHVTSAEYGAAWPFTVPEGTLVCDVDGARKLVRLDTGNGIQYGINGSAKTVGFPDSAAIHKPGIVGINLQPLIDRGLTLCEQ